MAREQLDILFADDDFVAIGKPAGLPVIPGRHEPACAFTLLASQLALPHSGPDDPRLRVLHRIDKDTSGLVLFARNRPAQQHVSHQFQNNQIRKEYLAIVAGRPAEEQGEINAAIAPHPKIPGRMIIAAKRGRPARTLWQVEALYRQFALIRVFPQTGKTHQIRIHLRHIGLPLAIDPLYNPAPPGAPAGLLLSAFKRGYRGDKGEEERPLISRLTLHAHKLAFRDMADRLVQLEAPLPRDFRAAINMLTKYAR